MSTELFDTPWYPGDAVSTAELVGDGDWTTLTIVICYASKEARDGVPSSRMAEGVTQGYAMLDRLLVDCLERGAGP
ncbi:MAG: hypothetical protein V4550_01980 [Gemmatimonadota bacterium]